jgi:hypothetical protein
VLRQYTVDAWMKKKASDQKDVLDLVQQQVDLAKLAPAQRAAVRLELEPQLLASMRQQPKEPMARWALALYEAAHQPLAAGTPPLTRQGTDAFLEVLCFMLGESAGQQVVPDQKLKDEWARGLAANYPKMSVELKQQIAAMPAFITTLRLKWPSMPESERAPLRAQWSEQVKSLLPPATAAPAPTAQAAAPKPAAAGKKSVAEMMAEQNRRHESFMQMSDMMMNNYRMRFNAASTLSGSSYRYW